MNDLIKSAAFVLLCGLALNAEAQTKPASARPAQPPAEKKPKTQHSSLFDKFDLNKDGKISKEEAEKSGNKRLQDNFTNFDSNKDGSVSREELKNARTTMKHEKPDASVKANRSKKAVDTK